MSALQAQASPYGPYYSPAAYHSQDTTYTALMSRLKSGLAPAPAGSDMAAAAAAMAAVGGPAALGSLALAAQQAGGQDPAAVMEAQARLQSKAAAAAVAHLAGGYGHGHPGYPPAGYQQLPPGAALPPHLAGAGDPAAKVLALGQLAGAAGGLPHGYMAQAQYSALLSQQHQGQALSGQQYDSSSRLQYSSQVQYSGGSFPAPAHKPPPAPAASLPPPAPQPPQQAQQQAPGGPAADKQHQHQLAAERPPLKRPASSQDQQGSRKKAAH
jgi:hypothetical protein